MSRGTTCDDVTAEAEEQEWDHLNGAGEDFVERVNARGTQPVEIRRAVMDGVDAPEMSSRLAGSYWYE